MNPLNRIKTVGSPAVRIIAPVLLALSLIGAALPMALPTQAAGLANLKIMSCSIMIDVEYPGEWYFLVARHKNVGTADTGPFRHAVQYVHHAQALASQNLYFNAYGDEVRVEQIKSNVKPGQEVSVTRSVTKRVVDKKLWGFFLDTNNQVNEGGSLATERNDNFCSAYVNS